MPTNSLLRVFVLSTCLFSSPVTVSVQRWFGCVGSHKLGLCQTGFPMIHGNDVTYLILFKAWSRLDGDTTGHCAHWLIAGTLLKWESSLTLSIHLPVTNNGAFTAVLWVSAHAIMATTVSWQVMWVNVDGLGWVSDALGLFPWFPTAYLPQGWGRGRRGGWRGDGTGGVVLVDTAALHSNTR